jgi:soluble lytic murein transglycosylase
MVITKINRISLRALVVFALYESVAYSADPEIAACPQAVASYKAGQFDKATGASSSKKCPKLRLLSHWKQLREGQGAMSFDSYRSFVHTHGNWPFVHEVKTHAEGVLTPQTPATQVIHWFSGRLPKTFFGLKIYAAALLHQGQEGKRRSVIREAWQTLALSATQVLKFLKVYGALLDPGVHRGRFNALLEKKDFKAAAQQVTLCATNQQAFLRTRLALRSKESGAAELYASLPVSTQQNPILLEDYFHYLLQSDSDEVSSFYTQYKELMNREPDRFWKARYIMARDALARGEYDQVLSAFEGLELEDREKKVRSAWLVGWTNVRFLDDPSEGIDILKKALPDVLLDQTKAEFSYWIARGYEMQGQGEQATNWYKRAAHHPTTYYGQEAATKLGRPLQFSFKKLHYTAADKNKILQHPFMAYIRLLKEMKIYTDITGFFVKMLSSLKSEGEKQAFIAVLAAQYPDYVYECARSLGRANRYRECYPIPRFAISHPDPAFVKALILQESSFNTHAKSPKGALGLMQLMPKTAEEAAQRLGFKIKISDLNDRPDLNVKLGLENLKSLQEAYQKHYEIILASYNAGPGNSAKWLKRYGDPRTGEVDPVTWVQLLPFSETRAYVKSVLANYRVYQILGQKK